MAYLPAEKPLPYRLPLVGRLLREVIEGDADNKWYMLVVILTGLVLALMQWGLPALVMAALGAAPVCLIMLVLLTRG